MFQVTDSLRTGKKSKNKVEMSTLTKNKAEASTLTII